ncbi:MAG: prepilin-type N-terminal cleavage/methylation domain-containing protein [Candidatus Falkowbacteria bacterium]
MSKPKKAFTLIELLVSIAIIGAIISISMVSFSNVRQKARDTKRISDIKLIQKSLENYYRNEGSYPASLTPGQSLIGSSSNVVYTQVPENPYPRNDGNCPDSNYIYQASGNSYTIDFCLSETTSQLSAGNKCATPQGIKNEICN